MYGFHRHIQKNLTSRYQCFPLVVFHRWLAIHPYPSVDLDVPSTRHSIRGSSTPSLLTPRLSNLVLHQSTCRVCNYLHSRVLSRSLSLIVPEFLNEITNGDKKNHKNMWSENRDTAFVLNGHSMKKIPTQTSHHGGGDT